MRLLGEVRLSADSDSTTSPVRQREVITGYAKVYNHTIINISEDIDVSGAIPPASRPSLGPWLTDPELISQWDGIIVAKLDRLSRSLIDFSNLVRWCNANGKAIISVGESIDFSTANGRLTANILMLFAEFERERMSERRSEAAHKLKTSGFINGGVAPFGYQKVNTGKGWILQPDPVNADILRSIADQIISGKSASSVCKDLMSRGISTPKGKTVWPAKTLIDILRSPIIRGYVVQGNPPKIMRDNDCMPITREALIDDVTWSKLQTALDNGSQNKYGYRSDASPLLSIIKCGKCGGEMHIQLFRSRGYAYYKCSNLSKGCDSKSARTDALEKIVYDEMLAVHGDEPVMEKFTTAAEDHASELVRVTEAIAAIDDQFAAGELPAMAYSRMMTRLEADRDRLESLQSAPREPSERPTGQTVSETWATLQPADRRAFILARGYIFYVTDGQVNGIRHPYFERIAEKSPRS